MVPLPSEKKAIFLIAWIVYGILLCRSASLGKPLHQIDSEQEIRGGTLRLFVTGEVQHPGDYEFEFPATVSVAIQAAGGPTGNADLNRLNLNEQLLHKTVLRVPSVIYGFVPVISLNRSTVREFMDIPGIGPKLAERIVHQREENGMFNDARDLLRVHGIGSKKLRHIMKHAVLD